MRLPSLSRETLRHLGLTQLQKQAQAAPLSLARSLSLFPRSSPPGPAKEREAEACFPLSFSPGIPRPRRPPSRWDHGARFLPLHQPPPAAPTLPGCGGPCCRMMSASANGGAPCHPAEPPIGCAQSPPPPPPVSVTAAVRCGAAAEARLGEGKRRGRRKKKKNLHKKTDDQTHRAAGRHFAQQQGEPERAAPAKHPEERERERERETRDTRTGELDRKKYP